MEIQYMSAVEIKKSIEKKQITCKELINEVYKRINKVDHKVNSYITLCKESALKDAEVIDNKIENGEKLGKLAGVPIAIKDNICTDGIRTTCASKMLEDFISPYDATVIKKLKSEDAIIIGKTNMDEFAMGSSTENSAFKKTCNPWDLKRVPGGSSGGSAAAVASGTVPLSLGSDTGGSIRQPAAFCGVVGLKPTYGLISRFGLIAFASSLDQIGPFGRNVSDCAMMLDTIKGLDSLDSTSSEGIIETDYLCSIDEGIKGFKIGLPKEFLGEGLNSEIKDALYNVVEKLKYLGASVEEISLPINDEGLSAYYLISSAEASSNLARYDGIRYGYRTEHFENIDDLMELSRTESFGDEVKRRIMLGTFTLSSGYYDAYYNKAQKLRKKIKQQFSELLVKYDLILSPVSPILPFMLGEKSNNPLEMYLADIYTVNINLAGVPALSLPCGFSKNNLPIGIQLIGPHFGENKIFKAAYAIERELNINTLALK